MPGKRPRQIRRTTSMSQLGSGTPQSQLVVPFQQHSPVDDESMSVAAMDMSLGSGKCIEEPAQNHHMAMDVAEDHAAGRSVVAGQVPYAKVISPAGFLEFCFLCRRRLGHGKDIFMYRGDRAFCSIECRCHQIAMDERRERCRVTAVKKGTAAPPANTTGSNQQVVPAETAAAA